MIAPIVELVKGINHVPIGWKFPALDTSYNDCHWDYTTRAENIVNIFTKEEDINYMINKENVRLELHNDTFRHTNDDHICGLFTWRGKFVTVPSVSVDPETWTRFFKHDDNSECVICMTTPSEETRMTVCMICCSQTCKDCVNRSLDERCAVCRTDLDRS